MRQDIANVIDTRQIHDQALEAKTKASMAAGSVTAQITVVAILLGIHAQFFNALLEKLKALFTLRTTNDFTDARDEAVRCSNRFLSSLRRM